MTRRLYLEDAYLAEFSASVEALESGWVALDATAFYPGGGGQPSDRGTISTVGGPTLEVEGARADAEGRIWHRLRDPAAPDATADVDAPVEAAATADAVCPQPGAVVQGRLEWGRRYAHMRHHTLLHIVNALVLRDYAGLITGVQIGESQSRIDFRVEGFGGERTEALQAAINEVISRGLDVGAYAVTAAEFQARTDLTRTADVAPPVRDDAVRVVAIAGFDAQACGGTHVRNTAELGACTILRTENKGRNNKRLYLALG